MISGSSAHKLTFVVGVETYLPTGKVKSFGEILTSDWGLESFGNTVTIKFGARPRVPGMRLLT